jgi:hypothetical protein
MLNPAEEIQNRQWSVAGRPDLRPDRNAGPSSTKNVQMPVLRRVPPYQQGAGMKPPGMGLAANATKLNRSILLCRHLPGC